MRGRDEKGIALIAALLVTMLMAALAAGFTAVVMGDNRYRIIDRNRNQAFYAASAGIEKLTADLGSLFLANVSPTPAQLTGITASGRQPVLEHVAFGGAVAPETIATSSLGRCAAPNQIVQAGGNGYSLRYCAAPNGRPTTSATSPIKSGPYEGLIALQTPFQVDVTARMATGGEVHLARTLEAVAIPVFQFGLFSDVDLAFFAGPSFGFGGRVHTNGNLFLAQGGGNTLTMSDKVTAVGEVIRQRLQNGASLDDAPAHTGTVRVARAPGVFRDLLRTEGSLVDGVGSARNEPVWHTVSLTNYNSWVRNGRTGAKQLQLPLITAGGSNPDLIRRPAVNEDATNPILLAERLYTKASLRILLSDTAGDITGLPGVTATPPVALDGNWVTNPPNNGTVYGPVDATRPPIARSPGLTTAIITVGAAAGANRTLTIGAGVPAMFRATDTLTVTSGANTWTLTGCSTARTATTVTCTAINPSHAGITTLVGAAVSGTVATLDGNVVVTSTLTANWVNNAMILTVANTMPWALNDSFWVNDNLISCTGHTATTLTGCTLPAAIANNSTLTDARRSDAGTGTIGGFLKIERADANGTWLDVTMEVLNYGIGAPNLAGGICADPSPDAILRLQRLRDNNLGACPFAAGTRRASNDYWPNVLFDAREALQRDVAAASLPLGGVMHYITLDVQNLARWFAGAAPYGAGTGAQSRTENTGFTVYFSDRRTNRSAAGAETGEYGWEDVVNTGAAGAPNDALDTGEDVNGNGALEVYGRVPSYQGVYNTAPPGASAPLDVNARPTTLVGRSVAQVNRALLFRRALKLVRGSNIVGQGVNGLTIVAENPVYVQGDWNATGGSFNGAHAATAVMADSLTLLSNNWSDVTSFTQPFTVGNRNRVSQTWYRLAVIAGKGRAFAQPVGTSKDTGTDGGAHNFLRFLENGDQPVNYRGSLAVFYYARQANGIFKCCTTVYGAPTRNFAFDTDFLNPALLPPNTPVFRDLNAVGFAQELRPGR